MTELRSLKPTTSSAGEAAVDGMLAGIGAGLAMAVYLVGAGWLSGEAPGQMLARFDPSGGTSPLLGMLAHLAVAGIYGLVFALAWRALGRLWPRLPVVAAGLAYGVLLYGLAQGVLLPWAGSALLAVAPLHLLAAHLVYGLVLGLAGRRAAQ
jgi:hypothetical protein